MIGMRWVVIRVVTFVAVTGLFGAGLGIVAGDFRIAPSVGYSAMFADVSGLTAGQDVKAAGVVIGKVSDVELRGTQALVSFNLDSSVPLTTTTRAAIRWKDVIGDRYIDLTSPGHDGPRLPAGATIPETQTAPSLDLDQLSNGFKPLFQGLDPAQVNQLSTELIQVFQGQGTTLQQLFADLGAFTDGLADRDAVIGQVVDNLNTVLGTLDHRRDDVANLIVQTDRLAAGLNSDRDALTSSFSHIATASDNAADLLARIRPATKADLDQIGKLASLLNNNQTQINDSLTKLPPALNMMSQLGRTGSYFGFYLCGVQIRTSSPTGGVVQTPMITGGAPRCQG